MARQLMRLLEEPELRCRFGAHNQQRFESEFTTAQFEKNWGVLLNQISTANDER
jgi:hypothetical protein